MVKFSAISIGDSIVRSILLFVLVSTLGVIQPTGAAIRPVILVFGDSLSAGYGLAQNTGWVDLLQQRLRSKKLPHAVINASISGETSAGGLTRLPATLNTHKPNIVVLELGANDGLRGLTLSVMRNNLQAMITACTGRGASVILVGIRLPTNYGKAYTEKFQQTFYDLSKANKIAFVPSLLSGIETRRELFQADGFHPSAEAQDELLENVWRELIVKLRG